MSNCPELAYLYDFAEVVRRGEVTSVGAPAGYIDYFTTWSARP